MESNGTYRRRVFKGAGIILGFLMGSLTGIVFVIITGVTGLIGAVSVSVALPLSLFLEKKFRRREAVTMRALAIYLPMIVLGTVLFIICFLAVL